MTKDSWSCPKCRRVFTQVNQRHACGTGSREEVLRNRPAALVHVYELIEAYAKTLGPVEIVTRQRYALFRSVRIFADLTVMTSCVRLVIHLRRQVADPAFSKIVAGDKMAVSHVAKLTTRDEWDAVKSYFEEAYRVSLSSGPFYHGTKADLKPGDLITPGHRSNYGSAGRASRWVYMTATLSPLGAELARGDGPGRLYIVEPTGPFVDDPDLTDKKFPGNPTKSYRSRYPLRVIGEVTDWEPHSPEEIKAMLDRQDRLYALQAERIARIPSASDFDRIRSRGDELARDWAPAPEYLGCTHLMLIRGTEADVYSALSYRSEALGETRVVELPCPIAVQPGELQREVPLSGWITDLGAWREAWVAVIESCVTEIGLSSETRIWIAADANEDTLRFRVDADGPERSWQRNLQLVRGVLTDAEQGEIWDFDAGR